MDTSHISSLASLLQDSEKLAADINGGQELPRVVRSITQMVTDGDQLWSRVSEGAASREQADVQAAILLGSQGFNLPNLSHHIDQLTAAQTFAPIQSIQATDIDGFLRNERQNALTSAILEHSKNTNDDLASFVVSAEQERWEDQKRKVLSSIEFSADTTSDMRFQSFNDSLNMTNTMSFSRGRDLIVSSTGAPIRARLSPEELKYARALSEHNAAYLCGALLGESQTLVDKMAQVAEQLELKDVALLWQVLQAIQCKNIDQGNDRLSLMHEAKRFLEKKHLKDLRATVYGNLNKAALGGVPGTAQLIRAYLNVRPVPRMFSDEPVINDHPVWAVLYHALRCGDLACAREVAQQAGMADLAGKFQECQRNPHQRLGDASAAELRIKYMRDFGLNLCTGNPHQRVVLAVLAGCDVDSDHGPVGMASIEDYLWIMMCKALAAPISHSQDVLPLAKLQSRITDDYGETHFDAAQRPLQFAYVLLLTAQFEVAIEFLYRTDVHKCHAVHMAIALNQLGLLRNTAQTIDPVLVKEGSNCQLNLPRLITSYTRRFEMSEPELALEYYYALKEKYEPLWLQCVIELALETKAFTKILGQRNADGGTVQGALDKFVCTGSTGSQERNRVATAVAEAAESRGLNEEAVALYELANEKQKCVDLLTKVLSLQVDASQ
ncbi:nuclear pore complex protein Nup93-like isoform X2 [Varroa destructor]|uniref:Nuclear pore protein n=1 Tax=Varroa destructor TaxID=109461 RepID=A0A7M7KPL5_VARDE|nr:nuclear pore complex protein Nup93-like isoform X2 [Varroa destructor]